jgi:hypothetical protein
MFEYRVTKYDPVHRDAGGHYRRDEWTMFSQVGRSFGGVRFTVEEYHRVEDAYVATALSFWRESGSPAVAVLGLSNPGGVDAPAHRSTVKDEGALADVMRRILRDEFWCRLESDSFFLHFGWDYYMYVGVCTSCSTSHAVATESGLFVEEFPSPYLPGRM